jgi:hypothetical protein
MGCTAQTTQLFYDDGKICNYRVIIESPVFTCNILGEIVDSLPQVALPGALFTVIDQLDEEHVIIRFWAWKENTSLNKMLCYADSLGIKRKYFLMSVKNLERKSMARFDKGISFAAGTVLVPFKLRLQHSDFSKDFTLGPSVGIRFRLSHYMKNFVNVMGGMGITSVTISNYSVDGEEREDIEVPALTPSLGFVFEFSNATQAGVFIGWDFVSGNQKVHFAYHSKPWISFGLGYTLLSQDDKSLPDEERKQ